MESPINSGLIASTAIKLTVISGQLRVFAEAVDQVKAKAEPKCPDHPAMETTYSDGTWFCNECISQVEFDPASALNEIGEETASLAQAVDLTRNLLEAVRRDLGDAVEKEN
jgi:hypothetical protein